MMTDNEKLTDMAKLVFAYQERHELKVPEMLKEFPELGSAKTFRDLRNGCVDGYDVETQMNSYALVAAAIEAAENSGDGEMIYTKLSSVVKVRRAAIEVMKTNGSNRVVIVVGPSGGGKTWALKALRNAYGSRVMIVEAMETWNDGPANLLSAIIKTFGHVSVPARVDDRFDMVVDLLRTRRMLAFDEAHHFGPRCLNTLKALVNNTPGEFMLLAINTLWERLMSQAYQEARQISTNRLNRMVKLAPSVADVSMYIGNRFEGVAKVARDRMATMVLECAASQGNISYVRDVCANAADSMEAGDELSVEIVKAAVEKENKKRSSEL